MATIGAPVIEVQGASVRAGGKTLLDAVTLAFSPAQCVAIVGPNGAGKTTLLRLLGGELRPGSGAVRLKGRDVASYAPRALAEHRAVLSQSVTVVFPFTVAEIVRMGAGDRRGTRIESFVDDALREVGLSAFRERIITTLSGGEQQRAHFARVLVQLACGEAVHGPGMLMLDEPTASLDLRYQLDLLATTRRCAARGATAIAILHDLNLAALFADRIIVLDGGRVAGDGAPRDVITDEILAQVFKVGAAVGRTPPDGMPFVLPHAMTVA
jgi:iron complex transport system ATP-binding protein